MEDTHAQVVAIGNQKGGVAKSTNTVHLAAALGAVGRRCLIMDLDGHSGSTNLLGVPTEWAGTFEMLLGSDRAEDLILRTDPGQGISLPTGVDLLPGSRKLFEFQDQFRQIPANRFSDPSESLKNPIAELRDQYDYILLDTAPNLDAPTVAAYKVAEWFVLSMTPTMLAYVGMTSALGDIVVVRNGQNAELRLLGALLSQVDIRTRAVAEYTEKIGRNLKDAGDAGLFQTQISRSAAVTKAGEVGQTMFEYDPDHKVTDQYRRLAREVESRIGLIRGRDTQAGSGGNGSGRNRIETADA